MRGLLLEYIRLKNMNEKLKKKYIKQRGRSLPIERCIIIKEQEDIGLEQCMIIRKQPSGYFAFGFFLVDRYCLGIKNTVVNCNVTEDELRDIIKKFSGTGILEEVTPNYFHNLIYASVDYANELGFSPNRDFALAEYLLSEEYIDDGIDTIELGKDGKPLFIAGQFDNVKMILGTLNRNVGESNYDYIMPLDEIQ